MKRYWIPIIISVIATIIVTAVMAYPYKKAAEAARAAEETVSVLTMEQQNAHYTRTIYATGGNIQRIVQHSTLDLSGYTQEDIDALENKVDEFRSQCELYDCVVYEAYIEEQTLYESFDFDTSSSKNIKTLRKAGLLSSGRGNVLKLKDTLKELEDVGWTVIP